MSLRDNAMPYEGLDQAADIVAAEPYPNPRPFDRDAQRRLTVARLAATIGAVVIIIAIAASTAAAHPIANGGGAVTLIR